MRRPFAQFLLAITIWLPQAHAAQAGVATMQKKLEHVQANGQLAHPDPAPTEFSEEEVNAYMNSGQVQLPAGVKSVKFHGLDGVITGNARVDFDQLRAGRGSANPMLSIFSGVHDIQVDAHAYGKNGRGFVQVDTVALDGVEIPRFVLQMFVQKYVQPKYPEVGLDSQFALPDRIDTASVGKHRLIIVQK